MITWNPTRSIDISVTRPITEKFLGKSGYSPLSLFAEGEQGAWYDPSDLSTMFQDSAGTTPVTAAGQSVGLMRDKSGRGNHAFQITAASKPILRNSGSLWRLEFDGVDDFLVTENINFSAVSSVSIFSGLSKLSDAASGCLVEFGPLADFDPSFSMFAPSAGGANKLNFRERGTSTIEAVTTSATYAAPLTAVVTGIGSLSSPTTLRANGAQVTQNAANPGGGTFGTRTLYIGRRGGSAFPFKGYLFGLVVRGAATDATGITDAEKFMAAKSGVTL